MYELTPAGHAEMRDWLRALIGEPVKEYTHFEAGLCLLGDLPPGDAIELSRRREVKLEGDHRELRSGARRGPRHGPAAAVRRRG